MTQLIPSNLPVRFQCLCAPTEWSRAVGPAWPYSAVKATARALKLIPSGPTPDGDFLRVHEKREFATNFDPWEKRNQFFRLKLGDTAALLDFLPTVGFFGAGIGVSEEDMSEETHTLMRTNDGQRYETRYFAKTSEKYIWGVRGLLIGSLKNVQKHSGKYSDFQVRFLDLPNGPGVILTTTTFLQSILLTLAVDKVRGSKVRKCARPDCGVLFSITDGHKRKYCEWYCGHIESVRKQRRKAQRR